MSRELTLRILSACVLVPFGLFVVWSGGMVLAVACALFAAVMAKEWAGIAGLKFGWVQAAFAAVPVLVGIGSSATYGFAAMGVLALAAFATTPGNSTKRAIAGFGHIYTALPPFAMALLRETEDGLLLTMIVMVLVWVTDISAFFGGRGFGGPLLSPRESPNKRWSGAVAAFVATSLLTALVAVLNGMPVIAWIVAALSISVSTQLGDLLESRFKRAFGVKDAGQIIPGHGGLLDRVDGLGAAMMYALFVLSVAPAARILLGLSA